jgi:hypothetical protein
MGCEVGVMTAAYSPLLNDVVAGLSEAGTRWDCLYRDCELTHGSDYWPSRLAADRRQAGAMSKHWGVVIEGWLGS